MGIGAAVRASRVRRTVAARNAAVAVLALASFVALASACSGTADDGAACPTSEKPNAAPAAEPVRVIDPASKSAIHPEPIEVKNTSRQQIPASFAE